jgi:hypothetical protein
MEVMESESNCFSIAGAVALTSIIEPWSHFFTWTWQVYAGLDGGSKPWAGSELPCNETDRLLFNSSTTITIGVGAKVCFWHNNWLEGEALRNLAVHLFEMVKRTIRSNKNFQTIGGYTPLEAGSPPPSTLRNLSLLGSTKHPADARHARLHCLEMDGGWYLLYPFSVQDLVQRLVRKIPKQHYTKSICGKQMQNLCPDTCAVQNSNGAQHAQKRMASPRRHCTLCYGPLETDPRSTLMYNSCDRF